MTKLIKHCYPTKTFSTADHSLDVLHF